jgi:hypothetical protein
MWTRTVSSGGRWRVLTRSGRCVTRSPNTRSHSTHLHGCSTACASVSEALTNVVVHAYPGREPGDMMVEAWRDAMHLIVRVTDNGHGLFRTDSPGLGLGFGLMASMADEFLRRGAPGPTTSSPAPQAPVPSSNAEAANHPVHPKKCPAACSRTTSGAAVGLVPPHRDLRTAPMASALADVGSRQPSGARRPVGHLRAVAGLPSLCSSITQPASSGS